MKLYYDTDKRLVIELTRLNLEALLNGHEVLLKGMNTEFEVSIIKNEN